VNTPIYSVSELNLQARHLLEDTFGKIRVQGEISNLSCPTSGHWYFSLKDAQAQIRCAMFKNTNYKVNFKPSDGTEVIVLARVSLYPERGDYQLIVEHLESSGDGKLRQAFELLKNKLFQEGLFKLEAKKSIPEFPSRIGIISSSTGAAIHDIISVLGRRYPAAELYIYSCLVQGQTAAGDIARAIKLANSHSLCDVLIVARGGGSLEDLWPFNEEIVARTIYESVLPIVSGIGHETDFSIADLVADYRAPTPSAAAERVSPDQSFLLKQFIDWEKRLYQAITGVLQIHQQKVDYLENRLVSPTQHLKMMGQQLSAIMQRLQWAMEAIFDKNNKRFESLAYALGAINPFATLARGYSISYNAQTHTVVSSIEEIQPQDKLLTRLHHGSILSQVLNIIPHDEGL